MNARLVCLASAFALLPLAHAADRTEEGRYLAKPLKGDYYVYGGSIGDKNPSDPERPEGVVHVHRASCARPVRPHWPGCEELLQSRP